MSPRHPAPTGSAPMLRTDRRDIWRGERLRLARRRRSRARMLELVAVVSLVGPVALFLWTGGGRQLTGTWPAQLLALARIAGLEASVVLLLQMLLAARLPWVDRTYGHGRALVAHRLAARVSIPLLLAHVVALLAGRAALDGLGPATGWLTESQRLITGPVSGMVTAFLAFGGILVVAFTSVRFARRQMSHESWHLIHLAAYASVALSVPHQLNGPDIGGHPWVRLYWLALYLGTAGAAIMFRVCLPVWYSWWHRLVVVGVHRETSGVVSVIIGGRRLDQMPGRAGQFIQWRFLSRGLWAFAHPWSLSAAPDGKRLRITVGGRGDHSRALARLRPGTRVIAEGPYGAFTTERRARHQVLLVAAGIGITPLRALLEELLADRWTDPRDLSLLYRATDAESLVLADELEEVSAVFGVRMEFLLGPRLPGSWLPKQLGYGQPAKDAAVLARLVPGLTRHDVFICGPPEWMALVRQTLTVAGVHRTQIHHERFAW